MKPEDFFITNCPNNGVNVACRLPAALVGDFYTYAFSASVTGVTWEFSELPDWLKKVPSVQMAILQANRKNARRMNSWSRRKGSFFCDAQGQHYYYRH